MDTAPENLKGFGAVKGISLWNPWAVLVIAGKKRVETRSWGTRYRGGLVIHAALKWTRELRSLAAAEPFKSHLAALGFGVGTGEVRPPLRCLLGTVELADCVPVESLEPNETERAFGDFTPGRFGWVLRFPRPFPKPIPYAGSRGLFEVPNKLFHAVFPGTVSYEAPAGTEK